jgi:hypothetical protein
MPAELVRLAREVQRLPYRWPAPPDAASTEASGAGSCAGKHALLAQRLAAAGLPCAPLLVVGPLAPPLWPDLADEADGLLEVHECLTALTPWSGPLTVDVTWHPAAVDAGLPGVEEDWDGRSDTATAEHRSRLRRGRQRAPCSQGGVAGPALRPGGTQAPTPDPAGDRRPSGRAIAHRLLGRSDASAHVRVRIERRPDQGSLGHRTPGRPGAGAGRLSLWMVAAAL